LITFLRETFVGHYVPFDSNIAFHKYVAMWALIFTGIVLGLFYVSGIQLRRICLAELKSNFLQLNINVA
jgi:hypothetical protein